MPNFIEKLDQKIDSAIWNNYEDNYDYYRFGPKVEPPGESNTTRSLKWASNALGMNSKGGHRIVYESLLAPYLNKLENFHQLLADDQSRDLLVNLAAYRILGMNKIKLPLNTPEYWQGIEAIRSCVVDENDFIQVDFRYSWKLYRFNLAPRGIPVEMYFTPKNIYTEFLLRQYEFQNSSVNISVKDGDTVIDAGACWGDTALLFAYQVGYSGQVYSFEFLPSNISILRRNIMLNNRLAERISVIEKPLWETSDRLMYYFENGPGSRVGFEKMNPDSKAVETICIDDLVERQRIQKVDFIKMDIEGAEQPALRGAIKTIRRFRPKLAIAIYHNLDDFAGVAELINSMGLGYKFYLGHFSVHSEETILFAEC